MRAELFKLHPSKDGELRFICLELQGTEWLGATVSLALRQKRSIEGSRREKPEILRDAVVTGITRDAAKLIAEHSIDTGNRGRSRRMQGSHRVGQLPNLVELTLRGIRAEDIPKMEEGDDLLILGQTPGQIGDGRFTTPRRLLLPGGEPRYIGDPKFNRDASCIALVTGPLRSEKLLDSTLHVHDGLECIDLISSWRGEFHWLDRNRLITRSMAKHESKVLLWEIKHGTASSRVVIDEGIPVTRINVDPYGRQVAIDVADFLRVFDAGTWKEIPVPKSWVTKRIRSGSFTYLADGVMVVDEYGAVHRAPLPGGDGESAEIYKPARMRGLHYGISPRERFTLSDPPDLVEHTVVVRTWPSGEIVSTLRPPHTMPMTLKWATEDCIVGLGEDESLMLFKPSTGECTSVLLSPEHDPEKYQGTLCGREFDVRGNELVWGAYTDQTIRYTLEI